MRKIIVTESQLVKIYEANGIYLDTTEHGTERPDNITADQVTVGDNPVTTDKVAKEKGLYRPYGWRSAGRQIAENDDMDVTYFTNQKERAAATGTKMGQHIANDEHTSEGTNRKRKFDLKQKRNEMGADAFKATYGDIDKMVDSRVSQTRQQNSTDSKKSVVANDKVVTDGMEQQLPNGGTLYLRK